MVISTELIASLSSVIVALLTALGTVIVKWLRHKGINFDLEALVETLDKAREFIAQAEGFESFSGNEKLNWVVSKLVLFCRDKGFEFGETKLKEIIENILSGYNSIFKAKQDSLIKQRSVV